MNNICSRCERSFNHKNSLRRHQTRRIRPCKPIVTSCVYCGNKFTCLQSLKKHEKLYCKQRNPRISLQDFIDQLPLPSSVNNYSSENYMQQSHDTSEVNNNGFSNDSLQELLNQIQFSPMMSSNVLDEKPISTAADDDKELPRDSEVLNHLDDILTTWLGEIQRSEGVYKSHSLVKEEIFGVVDRMLQDGLLSNVEYDDLVYTSNLFIRLHDLITMYIPACHKQSVVEILVDLYDMKKITRTVLIELYVNL